MNEELEQDGIRKEQNSFDGITFILMLVVAACFDGIQILISLIPVAGWVLSAVIGFLAGAIFFLWFALKGMRFLTKGKIITMIGTTFAEIVPIVDAAPVWTFSIIFMFILSKLGRAAPVLGATSGIMKTTK